MPITFSTVALVTAVALAVALVATLLGAPLAMAALTALPARASARQPVAEILRSEVTVR